MDLFIAEQCKCYCHNIYSRGLDNVYCTYYAPTIRGWVTTNSCQDIVCCCTFFTSHFSFHLEDGNEPNWSKWQKCNKLLNSKELFGICICFYSEISVIRAAFITSTCFHHQIKALPYLVLQLTFIYSFPKFQVWNWIFLQMALDASKVTTFFLQICIYEEMSDLQDIASRFWLLSVGPTSGTM